MRALLQFFGIACHCMQVAEDLHPVSMNLLRLCALTHELRMQGLSHYLEHMLFMGRCASHCELCRHACRLCITQSSQGSHVCKTACRSTQADG